MAVGLSESTPLLGRGAVLRPPTVAYMTREARVPLTEEEHYRQAEMDERCYTVCSRILNQVGSSDCRQCIGCTVFWGCPLVVGNMYGFFAGGWCFAAEVGCYACCCDACAMNAEQAQDIRNNTLTVPRITPVLQAAEGIRHLVREQQFNDPFEIVAQYSDGGEGAMLEFIARDEPLPTAEQIIENSRL